MTPVTKFLAATSAVALSIGLVSCSSSADDAATSASGASLISTYGSEPLHPLLPGDSNESGGGVIIDSIFSGLVYYDVSGAVRNEMAESITPSNGNQTYTVKLKKDMKFSDGTPVNADSFIDAWKYTVANDQLNASFFEPVKGFDDKSLSGVAKVDDLTFTIDLNQPESDFPLRLGYRAFFPLPKVAFDDMKAFGEKPVGNGMYTLTDWIHEESATVVANDNYTGGRPVKNDGVKFVFYPSPESAYTDLRSGNLDVMASVPGQALATYKQDLEGRTFDQATATIHSVGIPMSAKHFSGEEGQLRRAAISRAINRKELVEKILGNGPKPAKNFTSPVIDGFDANIPGNEVLTFDPEDAKKLWAKADAISPWDGAFTIAYNADGGNQEWVDAVTNQIKNALGIDAHGEIFPDFKSFVTAVTNREITSGYRQGWTADYPALANFMIPIFTPGAPVNFMDYDNPEFNNVLSEAASAPSEQEANRLYNKAQEYLLADLPYIPLYNGALAAGWSPDVDNVTFAWNAMPVFNEIIKK